MFLNEAEWSEAEHSEAKLNEVQWRVINTKGSWYNFLPRLEAKQSLALYNRERAQRSEHLSSWLLPERSEGQEEGRSSMLAYGLYIWAKRRGIRQRIVWSLLPTLCASRKLCVAQYCCCYAAENKGAGVCHFAEAARLRSYPFDTHPIPNFIRIRKI